MEPQQCLEPQLVGSKENLEETLKKLIADAPDWPLNPTALVNGVRYRPLPALDGSASSVASRARGSLLGLAWGDALGCPVEGYRTASIESIYGGRYAGLPVHLPVAEVKKVMGPRGLKRLRALGVHSDDTQQALALISVCLTAGSPVDVAKARKLWGAALVQGNACGAWRGTGRHFNAALHRLTKGSDPTKAGDASAGMGAAMRIGPLGALLRTFPETVLSDVVFNVSPVTHRTLEAPASAFAVAWTVRQFVEGHPVASIRQRIEAAVRGAEDRFLLAEKSLATWPDLANGGSAAIVIGTVLKEVDKLRQAGVTREVLWDGLRKAVAETAKTYLGASGASANGAHPGAGDANDQDDDVVDEHRSDPSKASRVKNEAKLQSATKATTRIFKFNPNQGHMALGTTHALMMALLDDAEIGDPNRLLCEIIAQGYGTLFRSLIACLSDPRVDTDTVCAIAGSMLGARFGTSWIPVQDLRDHVMLDRWATAIADLSPAPETLESLLNREAMWSQYELKRRDQLVQAYVTAPVQASATAVEADLTAGVAKP